LDEVRRLDVPRSDVVEISSGLDTFADREQLVALSLLTGTTFAPAILRLKSQEPIRATGVGVIRVGGLTLSGGGNRVIGWLKGQVGEAKAPAVLIKLIEWIQEQAGLPADGLLFHVSLDPPRRILPTPRSDMPSWHSCRHLPGLRVRCRKTPTPIGREFQA